VKWSGLTSRKPVMSANATLPPADRSRSRMKPSLIDTAHTLQGNSPAIRTLRKMIDRVADNDAPVLILGETGTGKELVARAIHQRSRRSAGPMVSVNCGAIAPTLMQSEFFGYERHAFTGAGQRRLGSIEAANQGALFLDEIGELPLSLQPALLRVLQDRAVTRLGATAPVSVDFRLLAATNVNLEEAIRAGHFREDLYYRISVLVLKVPPLRERGDDLITLAEHFVRRFSHDRQGLPIRGFTREAIAMMQQHRWPGNVRELMNTIHRAVVLADADVIDANDLGLHMPAQTPAVRNLAQARDAFERNLIRETLRAHGSRIAPAARELGVSRVTLYRLVARLDLADCLHPNEATTEAENASQCELRGLIADGDMTLPTRKPVVVSEEIHDCNDGYTA
jgi:DNA-binding NtrC family response regulator